MLEVIVTLSVIGILSGIGIVSLTSSRNQAKLKNAQTEVAATIKLAQSYALQGKLCPNGDAPGSYQFEINNHDEYRIRCRRSGGGSWITAEDYSLSGGVEFLVGNGSISFDVPHANKSGLSNITFRLGSAFKTISINNQGVVTIN